MVGRNDPCPCGSGKKHKKCCYKEEAGASHVNQRGVGSASEQLMQAVTLHQAGKLDAAEAQYRRILNDDAGNADALHYLGMIAYQRSGHIEACELIERAIRIRDSVPAYHCNLGNAYKQQRKFEQAIAAYQRAIALDPGFAVAYYNLGSAYQVTGQHGAAQAALKRALALNSGFAEAWLALGNAYWDAEAIDEAADCYGEAIARRSHYAEAYLKRGSVWLRFGDTARALADFDQAIQADPTNQAAQTSRLTALNYFCTDPRQIAEAHFAWGERFESLAMAPATRGKLNGRIRVGYVSGDLRQHALRFFMDPVLRLHDRDLFHIHCYYTYGSSDEHTERFKSYVETWLDCHQLTDEELAERIRADGIDILVDLSGHTLGGRLLTLARKPAPIQASMLGYLNTTGLRAMDYRITDAIACPPGMFDRFHTETLVRLPACQWCYKPDDDTPEVGPLPARAKGYTTFGVFNNLAKVTPALLELWAELLLRLPASRLRAVIWGKKPAEAVRKAFARRGVEDRLEILEPVPYREYLKLYREVDIILDTFPYSGGTTAFESLWMGVPYVTLVGNTVTSRGGASILHHLGLFDLIAGDPATYLEIAAALATDLGRLEKLRASLRQRLQQSPMMAEKDYVRALEALYRQFTEAAP